MFKLTITQIMTLAIAEAIIQKRAFTALRYSDGSLIVRNVKEA